MTSSDEPRNLDEVRSGIDRIDRQIVRLMAERSGYVQHAALFKSSDTDVEAPARVEAVIAKVRALAADEGLNPDITEQVYRTMIGAFIEQEKRTFHNES